MLMIRFVFSLTLPQNRITRTFQSLRIIANGVKPSKEIVYCLDCFVPRSDAKRVKKRDYD